MISQQSSYAGPSAPRLSPPWALAFAALLAAAGLAALSVPAGIALVLVGLIAPDLPLVGGFAERGRLKLGRVPVYNALHRLTGPALVLAGGVLVAPLLALGLGWAAHVAMDRSVGFGLRAADGWQRS
jgi:hypothetical protein